MVSVKLQKVGSSTINQVDVIEFGFNAKFVAWKVDTNTPSVTTKLEEYAYLSFEYGAVATPEDPGDDPKPDVTG